MDIALGNVPSSVLDNTDNVIFTEGELAKKVQYSDMKTDIVGSANLSTAAQTPKEAINELNQDLLDSVGYGVISGGVVSAQSTPNMTVQITACTYKTSTGARKTATANSSLAVATADITNPRIDIVYINSSGIISYLQGTATSSLVVPTTPTGGTLLAQINVVANQTTITNSNIIDQRKLLISTDFLNAQLSQKVDKSSIVNNLTATVAGSVLDATQGKALNDRLINTKSVRPSLSISATTNITITGITLATYTIPYNCNLFLNGQATMTVTTADRFTLAIKLNGTTFGYAFEEKTTGKKCLLTSGVLAVNTGDIITLVLSSLIDNSGTVYSDIGLTYLDLILMPR